MILDPKTVTSGAVEKNIRTTNEITLFLAGQFSGSWGEFAGIGRFNVFPSEEMRNTLPVKSAGLILEVPCCETDVDFLEVVGLREAFEAPPEEKDFRDPDPLIILQDPRFPHRKA